MWHVSSRSGVAAAIHLLLVTYTVSCAKTDAIWDVDSGREGAILGLFPPLKWIRLYVSSKRCSSTGLQTVCHDKSAASEWTHPPQL